MSESDLLLAEGEPNQQMNKQTKKNKLKEEEQGKQVMAERTRSHKMDFQAVEMAPPQVPGYKHDRAGEFS